MYSSVPHNCTCCGSDLIWPFGEAAHCYCKCPDSCKRLEDTCCLCALIQNTARSVLPNPDSLLYYIRKSLAYSTVQYRPVATGSADVQPTALAEAEGPVVWRSLGQIIVNRPARMLEDHLSLCQPNTTWLLRWLFSHREAKDDSSLLC